MITSTQQVKKVNKRIESLISQLDVPIKKGVPKHMAEVADAQIRDSIKVLENEVAEYEKACNANINNLKFTNFLDIMKLPIIIRLASRQSLTSFSSAIGISESQLRRYEACNYKNAPSGIVDSILLKFNLNLNGKITQAR